MTNKFTTALLSAVIVGGGVIGAGSLVANAYDTTDPTVPTDTAPDTDDTTATPNGLIAQVDDDTEVPADEAADDQDGERRGRRGGCGDSEALAEVLGLTTDELHDAREGGASLAEIAADQGVAVDDVVDAIVAERAEHLAEEVAEGEITQAEADERLADAETSAAEKVEATRGS
ncbi:MAG: hypothetical protein WBP59_03375 [Ilumatobacteraceae bacterium]